MTLRYGQEDNNLITAGELAKLSGTTKRTILWYDKMGIIKPKKVMVNQYRFYSQDQVLEYQMVHLLSTLGVSLGEIKDKNNLKTLFADKKESIKRQINSLQFSLENLNKFTDNLGQNNTLINPKILTIKPFEVYYIECQSSYVKIGEHCQKLANMFDKKGKDFVTLAIFENPTYQPKKSSIKIGVIASPGQKINIKFKNIVKKMTFDPGKVITYTHNGDGKLLSLFWKELEKYCIINEIKVRHAVPDFEIYRKVNDDPRQQFFEIYLPIK